MNCQNCGQKEKLQDVLHCGIPLAYCRSCISIIVQREDPESLVIWWSDRVLKDLAQTA